MAYTRSKHDKTEMVANDDFMPPRFECECGCGRRLSAGEWAVFEMSHREGYEQAVADITANGLPDHDERVDAALDAYFEDEDQGRMIPAYFAWQKEA